jgi:hypothetical protein
MVTTSNIDEYGRRRTHETLLFDDDLRLLMKKAHQQMPACFFSNKKALLFSISLYQKDLETLPVFMYPRYT